MSFDLKRFAAACETAAASDDAPIQIRSLLADVVSDPDPLVRHFGSTEEEESLLYASTEIVIVHLRLTPNVHYPPHNHNMVAVIGIYQGRERGHAHRAYDGRITDEGHYDYGAGEVAVLDTDAIHSVVNPHSRYSYGLHVYLGDLLTVPRSIWDPVSGEEHPYSDECYFSLARPYVNDKPYAPPALCAAHTTNAAF